jgi:hypothetical protein
MLATSVSFVDALSAFLSTFYGEFTNDEKTTSGTEACSLACSIVRRMFEDVAVHRCLASFVDFKNGVKQQEATDYRWASLQAHRYQLPPVPSSSAVVGVQRYPGGSR